MVWFRRERSLVGSSKQLRTTALQCRTVVLNCSRSLQQSPISSSPSPALHVRFHNRKTQWRRLIVVSIVEMETFIYGIAFASNENESRDRKCHTAESECSTASNGFILAQTPGFSECSPALPSSSVCFAGSLIATSFALNSMTTETSNLSPASTSIQCSIVRKVTKRLSATRRDGRKVR